MISAGDGPDEFVAVDHRLLGDVIRRLAARRDAILEVPAQAFHDGRNAAGRIEVFHHHVAGGPEIREVRRPAADFVEKFQRQLDASLVRDRRNMEDRVRRAAQRHVHGDAVREGRARQDMARRNPFLHERDDAFAGGIGDAVFLCARA